MDGSSGSEEQQPDVFKFSPSDLDPTGLKSEVTEVTELHLKWRKPQSLHCNQNKHGRLHRRRRRRRRHTHPKLFTAAPTLRKESAGPAADGDTGRYGSAVAMVTAESSGPKAQGGDPDEQVCVCVCVCVCACVRVRVCVCVVHFNDFVMIEKQTHPQSVIDIAALHLRGNKL